MIRPGESSSPSITNSPIWASQATPSAKERVAARCGSSHVAEHQRRDVDGGEAGAVHGRGRAVREEGEGEHRERVEAGRRERRAAHHPGAAEAGGEPDRDADHQLVDDDAEHREDPCSAAAPVEIRVTSTTVGASFSPDSASSAPVSRLGSGTTRSTENTAAASVGEVTAPSSTASSHGSPSR